MKTTAGTLPTHSHSGYRCQISLRGALLTLFILLGTALLFTEVKGATFLRPPGISWGDVARLDSNNNGVPDPGDESVGGFRSGPTINLVSTRFLPRFAGQATGQLGTLNPVTGRFHAMTTTYRDENGITNTITLTTSNFDLDTGRPNVFSITQRAGTRSSFYTVSLIDSTRDGIFEALTIEGTNQARTTINLVQVDVNGDGRADFITIPWAAASILGVNPRAQVPQAFIPLGDTNEDGTADAVAFDFDNNGKADPDLQSGPTTGGALPTADLAVTKAGSPDPALAGSNLTYTCVVTNNGPSAASGVTLTDTLPSGMTFVSATSTRGTCSQSGGTVSCGIGSLDKGASATVTIVGTPTAGGALTNRATVAGSETDPSTTNNTATSLTQAVDPRLYFAQFGNGSVSGKRSDGREMAQAVQIFSQIMLFNLDTTQSARVRVSIRDDPGNPLSAELNGEMVPGEKEVTIPAGGMRILRTSGQGAVTVGSVTTVSDRPVAGVVLFGGTIGLAGVGSSAELTRGFVTPVESNSSRGVGSGIAVMSLESRDVTLDLQLSNPEGRLLSSARVDGASAIKANGHLARFLQEFNWNPSVDFSNFTGLLRVTSSGRIAATVLQTHPSEFATLPAAPIGTGDQNLYFAQFGDGEGAGAQLLSKIMLFELAGQSVNARILIKGDSGSPLSVDLNGEVVAGQKDVVIPANGLGILQTDGRGSLAAGSVTVNADRALSGVTLFSGTAGVAGVGNSAVLTRGFVAPVESNTSQGTSTGIAAMSLETTDVTADLQLYDTEGRLVATARLDGANALKANGHFARFLPEFNWSPQVNFSSFTGLLKVISSGRIAATVLQIRPGQFATLPVAPR